MSGLSTSGFAATNLFSSRPRLLPARPDGLFVAFFHTFCRFLGAPSELPQQSPDMPRMVAHAEQPAHGLSDPCQRPRIVRIAEPDSAAQQSGLQFGKLRRGQLWQASGATGCPETFWTRLLPLPMPSAYALTRDTQFERDFSLAVALAQQPHRSDTSLLQRRKIPFQIRSSHNNLWTHRTSRTPRNYITGASTCHPIMRNLGPRVRIIR